MNGPERTLRLAAPASQHHAAPPVWRGTLQRCACGGHSGPSGECAECRKKRLSNRGADNRRGGDQSPSINAQPQGYAFGNVRVHSNAGHGALLDNNGGQGAPQAQQAPQAPQPMQAPFPCVPGQVEGAERSVDLQPVVFKSSATDASPTGTSWARRFASSNAIWGKLGVTFNALSTVEVVDATLKTSSAASVAQRDAVAAAHSGPGIEVMMVDNDMTSRGGGTTTVAGSATSKIVMSDRGTSDTLLAHELGHVLGLFHPPSADANTIMTPSGSNSGTNPTRNTMTNFNLITFPAAGNPVCIQPDP